MELTKSLVEVENTTMTKDEASYAWIGGWASGYSVSDVKTLLNDEVNSML